MKDLKFVAMFTEYEKGPVKASFRSKGNFPANEFAGDFFNGGGHFNAAGGKYQGTLSEAIEAFRKGLESYKEKLQSESKY
ncbi:MAG: DHHA1 domain-containing protein [Bacteroidales bacterium]|nr:DHHA1 domain-containing protein [Bacteroidales bacterium]